MERLYRAGIQNYIVIIGEDEGAIAAYLNSHWLSNVKIEFIIQSPNSTLTRTLTNISRTQRRPFLITTYNTFTHANFPEQFLNHHKEPKDGLLLTTAPITLSKSTPYAFAQIDNQTATAILHEKPNTDAPAPVIANLAICGDNFIQFLTSLVPNTTTFSKQLIDLFELFINAGGQTTISETSWLLHIEADYDLLTLNRQLLDDGTDTHILSELPPSVQIIPPVRIDPKVSVGQNTRLGPRVYLESGCSIGHHAVISNSVILQNTTIPARSDIFDTIISTRARIENPS
jgi:NDP-sugar pyrophosphorylase family protein